MGGGSQPALTGSAARQSRTAENLANMSGGFHGRHTAAICGVLNDPKRIAAEKGRVSKSHLPPRARGR
jgi:hypothetical protein